MKNKINIKLFRDQVLVKLLDGSVTNGVSFPKKETDDQDYDSQRLLAVKVVGVGAGNKYGNEVEKPDCSVGDTVIIPSHRLGDSNALFIDCEKYYVIQDFDAIGVIG